MLTAKNNSHGIAQQSSQKTLAIAYQNPMNKTIQGYGTTIHMPKK